MDPWFLSLFRFGGEFLMDPRSILKVRWVQFCFLFLLVNVMTVNWAHSMTYEFTFAGNAEQIQGYSLTSGISARMRLTSFKSQQDKELGFSVFANFPGIN